LAWAAGHIPRWFALPKESKESIAVRKHASPLYGTGNMPAFTPAN